MKRALLIFVKNAIEGKVKTRLAATVGVSKALEVYQQLLTHTQQCSAAAIANKFIFYADYVAQNDEWCEVAHHKTTQVGKQLGERMENALDYVFAQGMEQAVIIGSDCFEITTEIINDAFVQLRDADIVIGPALDGGYYLLGLKSTHRNLFQNIDWSTNVVLEQTLAAAHSVGLNVTQLPVLSDIDDEADWKRWLAQSKS